MSPLELELHHRAAAALRAALHEAYEAADRLCDVMMRARNGLADQALLDKATRRLYGSMRYLEEATRHFNAICVRIREGDEIRDGNGRFIERATTPAPRDDGPKGAA